MYLATVEVTNFRNIVALRVAFSRGLNVIVGENNVGKTNLLDAIRAGLGAASATGDPLRISKDDLHVDSSGNRTEKPIRVDLVFADLTEAERAQCLEVLNYNSDNPANSTASIHFEWSWNEETERWSARRWGGDRPEAEAAVPDEILQSIPLTLLTAMRDALSGLMPGRHSRLARVLTASAEPGDRSDLEEILRDANQELQKSDLIDRVERRIQSYLEGASGPDLSQRAAIQTSEPKFDRIVNNLRLVLRMETSGQTDKGFSTRELQSNGLGYNNLLYIGTVLAELELAREAALPILLVEEPEAHLHPQLQTLLADFLSRSAGPSRTQTILTTHSPTIASHVSPATIRVMHWGNRDGLKCIGLNQCGLTDRETRQLQRLLDVTKASLLFSKGVILVEGITEALLLPVLARRLGRTLEHRAVSVVPVHGVDFATIVKLFGESRLELPIAIVTDGDPQIVEDPERSGKLPQGYPSEIKPGSRIDVLKKLEVDTSLVRVFHSKVTLEYDLALSGIDNAAVMCTAWESLYEKVPLTFNSGLLENCGPDVGARALLAWRAMCLGYPSRSKAEFAQALAAALDDRTGDNDVIPIERFRVPEYLKLAIEHVTQ